MINKIIYKSFVVILLISSFIFGIEIGLVDIAGDNSYAKAYAESVDGTIQLAVTDNAATTTAFSFLLRVDYTTNVSTAKRKQADNETHYGRGYWRDFYTTLSWDSDEFATSTGTQFSVQTLDDHSDYPSTLLWLCSFRATGNGTYTITVNVIDDRIWEGGSDGTPETIEFYLDDPSCTVTSGKNRFTYKITDNDLKPYYGFAQTADQAFNEGHNTNNDGNGQSFSIVALPHPDDAVTYFVGHDPFELTWAITDVTTTTADYSVASGSEFIYEKDGGADNHGGYTSWLWSYNDLGTIVMTADGIDEQDTETFTITLYDTDPDGNLMESNSSLNVAINDDPEDLPPYVRFTNASQYVDEESSNSTVTVSLELNGGSGFANPSVAYEVSLESTAAASGDYQDHNLSNGTVTFDGDVGDQAQDITFTLIADAYDEGTDNDNTVVETIVITLDGDNVSNLRVDNDTYPNTTHTVNIRDNDATPQLAFSSDVAVTATSGAESVTSPTIKVVVTDGSGNLTPSALPITLSVTNHTSSPGTATFYSDATTPWDYKINGTTGSVTDVTIPAYSSEYAVPIEINSDSYYEGTSETVKFDVATGNNASGGTFTHTYTITEDDAKPTIYFTNGASIITSTETGDANLTGTVDVQLSAVSAKAVNFTYSITTGATGYNAGSGAAAYLSNSVDDDNDGTVDEDNEGDAADTDFSLPSSSGTIAAVTNVNETSASTTISFTHHVDTIDELDKYVQLTIATAVGEDDATVASDGTQTQVIKLADDDGPMSLSFAAATDAGNTEGATETITVSKTTTNTTTATEFTMNATISIGDSDNEATDGDTDDDFDLSTSSGTAISPGASQVLTFAPGDASASISITLDDDELYEGGSGTPEDIKFELSSLVHAVAGTHDDMTYYVVDTDDKPVISFSTDASKSVASGDENSVANPTITVKQDRRSIYASTIDYAVNLAAGTASADDFTLADGIAQIDALATETTIPLEIAPETKYEDNETVVIALDGAGSNFSGDYTTASGSNMSHTYTINNDDIKPTINFTGVNISGGSASASSPTEADGSATITVSLSAISGVASSVTYTIASSTGASDADWSDGTTDYDGNASTNIITWAADEATIDKTIKVNFTDDVIDEVNETITVTLSGVSGGAQDGSTLVHTITLQDSDIPPVMQFIGSTMDVDEDASTITIPLILTHDGTTETDSKQASDVGNAQLSWAINGQSTVTSHASTTDYPYDITTETSGTVVISKGQTDGSIIIPLNNDAIDEWNETVIIDLSSPVNATASGNQSITVTINDQSDASPTVNFTTTARGSGTDETVSASATINFTDDISLTGVSGKDLWFSYATEGDKGTATANQDYTPLTGNFKIAAGSLTPASTIPLVILPDEIDELDQQTVKITLTVLGADQNDDQSTYEATTAAESAVNGDMVFTYTIDDDDPIPNAFFKNEDGTLSSEAGTVDEEVDGSKKTITVALSAASERDINLYYSDAGTGTATSGIDYDYPAISDHTEISTISGAAGGGATEVTFDVDIKDDNIHEDNQTIVISLLSTAAVTSDMGTISYASAGGGSDAESVDTYTLTIDDDEEPPKANFTDGSNEKTAASTAAEDGGSHTITVELTTATEKTVTIPFTFSNDATIPATGANATGGYPVDFYYSEFTGGGSLTINAAIGDVTPGATFDLNILADEIDEWNEKIIINLGTPTNADVGTQTTHTVTINDVSPAPTINFTTLTVDDGTDETTQAGADYNMKTIIALDRESGRNLQFTYDTKAAPGTADAGFDYTEIDAATFTIAAGQTQTSDDMMIYIFPDEWDEDDKETVKVTIAVVGADQNGDGDYTDATGADVVQNGEMVFIYNINDDDPVPNAYFKNVDTVTDSETGTTNDVEAGTQEISVELSQASERDVSLYYSDAGTGDATSGNDYTAITAYTAISTMTGAPGGGPTEATFTVTTLADFIDEGTPPNDYQTVVLNLLSTVAVTDAGPASNALASSSNSGAEAVVSYTLQIDDDDDPPQVYFTNGSDIASDASTVAENGGTITINLELTSATERTVTIPFTFSSHATVPATGANSTGDYPTDFFYSDFTGGGSLTINGDGSDAGPKATFDITILADAIDEWDEKIVIDLGDPTNAQKGSPFQHTVTIEDQSAAPAIAFTTFTVDNGTAEATQANDDYNLKNIIALSSESGKDLTFSIKTDFTGNNATATAAQDYDDLNTTFTLTAGQTAPAANIILDILDDSYDEPDEQTVEVQIGYLGADIEGDGTYDDPTDPADPGATAASNVIFTYHINDDEDPPVLIFTSTTYNVDEDAGASTVVNIKYDPDDGGTTLTERVVTGLVSVKNTSTANNGTDITTISDNTPLVISDGIDGTTFSVTITDDDRWENAENIVLELGVYPDGTSNATIDGSNYETSVTIADDPADEPVIEFIDAEGTATATATVNESDLSFDVKVGITNSKISEKVITIPYTINFASSTARFDEDDDGTSTAYPADYVKWGSSSNSVYTTTALSYTAPNTSASGTITILAGDATTTDPQTTLFTVPINRDGIDENEEYLDFDLGSLTNASKGSSGSLRLTIVDHASDAPVKYSFATASAGTEPSASGAENESPTFMVVLLDPDDQTQLKESGKEITISWTIALDGTQSEAAKDATEAIDFKLPDFDGATSYTANLVFSPRTGSATAAPTSLTIGTSDIDFEEADVTYESTEYFKLSLAEADGNAAVGSSNGATHEHYYGITNIDSRPVIFLTDSDNGVSIYEQSSQGPNTHDFQFEVLSTGIQKSELPIYAYFRVSATSKDDVDDADISYSGTYEAGDLDYTYNSGPLDNNQSVMISAPITASSTGSITLAAYDDALYEQNEGLVLGMYTFDAAQAAALSLASESYATAPDGSKADDTGYDEVEVTIIKDPLDKPLVNFVNADGVGISTASFEEDSSGAKFTVRIKASTTSSDAMTIPYSITLDYDGDEKTARLGEQDNAYPYDYWIASSSEPNFSITGDKSSNTVAADGWVVIPASTASETNIEATFEITIGNDNIYEFDEKIILTLGTTSNAALTHANLGSNTMLTITIENTGETAPMLTLSSALTPDESGLIASSSATVSSYTEEATGSNEDNNDPHFEVKIVNSSGDATEAGMDLKYTYHTTATTDATAGTDFTATTAVGTIARGSSTSRFSIPILDDAIDEYDQVVKVTITKIGYDANGDDAASDPAAGDDEDALTDDIAANMVHTFTILDDDDPPVVSFYVENGSNKVSNVETQTVAEKATGVDGTHDVTVRASSVSEKLMTVNYSQLTSDSDCASDGNCAESGQDFTALADLTLSPFTIAVGQQENTFRITTTDDDRDEWDQDIVLELSVSGIADANTTVSSSEANGPPKYRLIIEDSDDEPFINFQSDGSTFETAQSVTEGNPVSTNVYLSRISEKTITIGYTIEATEADFGIFTAVPSDGTGAVTYPEDHAGLADNSQSLTNTAADNSTTAEEYLFEALTIATADDNIDEWDEKFKIVLNQTDHATNPTQNVQIGTDAPTLTVRINDNDANEVVEFSTSAVTADENNVTSAVGPDPGANSINLPITIAKQSGKNIVLKYSIDHTFNYPGASDIYYNSDYPNNENIATKGIDYSFETLTTNAAGDSIVTIAAGQTSVYIPLTIENDDFDEYDQKLRVSLSLANSDSYIADANYFDTNGSTDGVDAALGSDYIYTFTITDDDPEPYVKFEADEAVNEGQSGKIYKYVTVSLVDAAGSLVTSEKIITATYELDTDKGDSETDYTSASEDQNSNNPENYYEQDFYVDDGTLTFNGKTYTYNSGTGTYSVTDGDDDNTITLHIYGDDLYEVDEYVNIEITSTTNTKTDELVGGDHSYVYTIQNDDAMPSVTWVGTNALIYEGDPTAADTSGDYQNTDIKVALSAESGTDILVQYSLGTGGTAELGSDNNYDFDLGQDNVDLGVIGAKSVIIPAATAAVSEWTASVPIDVWDDAEVEAPFNEGIENFFLQIDGYRDKGADASWATDDDNNPGSSDNIFEVKIKDNDLPPQPFTVGSVITHTTNTETVISDHWNPIVPGYWNSYNTGLTVTVPIESNVNLIGGTVRLMVKREGSSLNYLSTPTKTITQDELDAGTYSFEVTEAQFEESDDWYAEDNVVLITAAITDNDGNITYGTESATTITIDEQKPVISFYTISSAVATGGNFVANYWNSTNTGLDVSVEVLTVDATVSEGSVRILAGIGTDPSSAAYYQLGSPVVFLTGKNVVGQSVSVSIDSAQVKNQTEYAQDETINLKAEVVDVAGNKTVINVASTSLTIDTVLPTISEVKSVDNDGNANNGLFGIGSNIQLRFTFSEAIKLTDGAVASCLLDVSTTPEIANADLQDTNSVTVIYQVEEGNESSNLTFTGLTLSAGNLRDNAGNDMAVFTAENSLADVSTVEVDGIKPTAFKVDTVYVVGSDPIYGKYWNSHSTTLVVAVENKPSDNDSSLVGGSVQLLGRVYDGNTAGEWNNIGAATILEQSTGYEPLGYWNVKPDEPYHYGQFPGKKLHFELDEATLEAMPNFPNKGTDIPEYDIKIDFTAIITDKAGNDTQGTDTTSTALTVDEIMPLDPAFGLPDTPEYDYEIDVPFDNYEQIVPLAEADGYSREGMFNSTNTGLTFKCWIGWDDPSDGAITIDKDPTLTKGKVQVQMSETYNTLASNVTWYSIGSAQEIQEVDRNQGFVEVTIDSATIRDVEALFNENNTLYFRNIVTDRAGNITEQSKLSGIKIKIDTESHSYVNLEYTRKYVNGWKHTGDLAPIITATFDSSDPPYSAPKLSAAFTNLSATTIDSAMTEHNEYTFKHDLSVPGDLGNSVFDGVAMFSISATDSAGNPVNQDVVTDKDYLVIDNTPPTVSFVYENTTNEAVMAATDRDMAKAGDIVRITAVPNEPLYQQPNTEIQVSAPTLDVNTYEWAGPVVNIATLVDGTYDTTGVDTDSNRIDEITYDVQMPSNTGVFADYSNYITMTINGTDWAENPIAGYTFSDEGAGNETFILDNVKPSFSNFSYSDNAYIKTVQLGWDNEENMDSAWVKFDPVSQPAHLHSPPQTPSEIEEGTEIALYSSSDPDSSELNRGTIQPGDIINQLQLDSTLADSNTYNIVFRGIDYVGNEGETSINFVTYDKLNPTADVLYETEYITSLLPVTPTTIKVTFNELQNTTNGVPRLKLFFGGATAQNQPGEDWDSSFNLSENPDTVSNSKKFTVDMINNPDSARIWYYDVDMLNNPIAIPADSDWDGYLWVEVISSDLAGNSFLQDGLDFDNSVLLDNTRPTATITYTNQRDPLLTHTGANADSSYCCFAIGGDQIVVRVYMNELIKGINPVPVLGGTYNKDNDGVGTVFSNIAPDSINIDSLDYADTLHYTITIPDGAANDGVLKLDLVAEDRTGTAVELYEITPQKQGSIDSSNVVLEIDNIHPWGYKSTYAIFEEPQPADTTFPTDTLYTTGYRVVDGWINLLTDSIKVKVPYQQPTTDSTLYGSATWGPIGKLDLQVKNLDLAQVQWQTIGEPDTLIPGIEPLGDYAYLRTVSRSMESLDTDSYTNGNKLLFRGVLTDKNGNVTYGQTSDMYVRNDRDLYELDSLNADTVGYDIFVPSLGDWNGGNFNTNIESGPIVSNDTVTISWSEFTDPGGLLASGVDRYELQIYEYDTTFQVVPVPGDNVDGIATDSVFTGDGDGDGINDVWLTIPNANAPTIENPFQQDTTMLKHNHYYAIGVRAFDVAGNTSEKIYTGPIQRINSAPEFVSLNELNLYEDIPWDYDTARVTDLDLSTLQGDSFSYSIMSWKGTESDTTDNKVESNPPAVDEVTGLISWTPIQNDTIDQAGVYTIRLIAEDQYSFSATMFANATVTAVNDTPDVAIIGQDETITWNEDKPATEVKMINLSKYVSDVDNADSTLSWQFVIMDTSQLDEDFPLATVIVGPGTPKKIQTQLMRDYMGFNPARGVDMPALARRSGRNTMRLLSRENSLITIDITTTNDSTYAIFNSDSNYYGSNHRIIFRAQDPLGAYDMDTVIVNIIAENDPPIVTAIDTLVIDENDSIWIDFSQYTTDVDDSTLTFTIEGVYNTDSITFSADPYLSHGPGDTILFNPFDLWSGHANFRVTASDEDAQSSQLFTLNVLRVPRPEIEVSLVQNNAFSSYVHIIIVDKQEKTKFLQLEVQNQRLDIDTVAAFTYTGDFSFGIGGGYSFDILAIAEVGKTIYTNTFNLAPARVANRWYASSSDGKFSIAGDPGSVDMDQSFLIIDSSLFISSFTDEASYVLGDESFVFNKPIEVQIGSMRDDLSIYQRDNGVTWKELPSINRNGQVFTFTENTGYFRLGPKTIIVPEETDLHQNYPNPFNPSTTIQYDIGLLDGLEQKVSVNVYNIVGQHVTTLVKNVSQVGQFYVKWDGADKFGKMLPSGIYFVQLRTDTGIIKNKKMMFLK